MNTRTTLPRRRGGALRRLGWLSAVSMLAVSAFSPTAVSATQPDPLHKVTICHRTNSDTNPYVVITVDEASVDGDNGNDHGNGDHLMEHVGPVWSPGLKDQHIEWGDIIPPFYSDGVTPTGYPSLNWNAAGQAIFYNDCNPVEATPTPTDNEPTPTPTDNEPTPTPTDNEPTPTPTDVEPTPTPTDVEPTPTPTDVEPTPTPTDVEPTPTGQELPAESEQPSPTGGVEAATGTPGVTPPSTDTISDASSSSSGSWRVVLAGLASIIVLALVFTQPMRVRRPR